MDRTQANDLIKMLTVIYPRTSLFTEGESEALRREIFIKILLPLDHETMREVIEKEIEYNKFCPTPAELSAAYKIAARNKEYRTLKPTNDNCAICHGLGYVLEKRALKGIPGPSEYILHCECVAGTKWKYDGRTNAKDKSDFYIQSVSSRGNDIPVEIPEEWRGGKSFGDLIKSIGR